MKKRKKDFPAWVRSLPAPTGADRLVLLTLSTMCDRIGLARPTVGEICAATLLGERQVQASLKALVGLRCLAIVASGGGRGRPTIYRLNPADCATVYDAETPQITTGFIREDPSYSVARVLPFRAGGEP